ncbi:hypothetical protein ACEQ8H_003163 [Pleosporales sp. CAS-2024a]
MITCTPLLLALAIAARTTTTLASPLGANASSWLGWPSVKHLFVFGDSYTQTGFDPTATQPTASNPLGNPPWPGWTSSNGPNWLGFLTATYNHSSILAYNLAYGGATLDAALVAPYQASVISMKDQVQTQYLPLYAAAHATTNTSWTAESSLFALFIGINDVGNTWWLDNRTALYDAIFKEYAALLHDVYDTGARNFLFLNVPPVNLSPLITMQDDAGYATEYEGRAIADWNARLAAMVDRFAQTKPGVASFVFDTNALFRKVIEDPTTFDQTAGYKNTTAYCKAYENGTPTWYTKDPSCDYPVNQYLWLNSLHPTFPLHNATAAAIVQMLS